MLTSKTYYLMKTITTCGLMSLCLASVPMKTEAASAPENPHPIITEIKSEAGGKTPSQVHSSRVVSDGVKGGSISASSRTKTDAATTAHHTPQIASGILSKSAVPVNSSFQGFSARYNDLMATPAATPAQKQQRAALKTTFNRLNRYIKQINSSIAKLSTARSDREAATLCDTIAKTAESSIDTFRHNMDDIVAMKLVLNDHKKQANAFAERGARIDHGLPVIPLRNLAKTATSEAAALRAPQSNATVVTPQQATSTQI